MTGVFGSSINPASADYLIRAIEESEAEKADALLIELLDSEVSLRRAETAYAAAICSYNRTQHLLRQAIGG